MAVQEAHSVHIAASCRRDECSWVDGAPFVKQVLEATQLGRPKCYFPPAAGCIKVRITRETMRDRQLNNRQMASLDSIVQDYVINRAAMRECEADAVVMTCTVSV
jgi:hypothetical protein